MVDQLLGFCLRKNSFLQISFNINIQESGNTSHTHGSAILGFNRCKISEVQPLDCLFCIFGRTGNIKTINSSHFLHSLQRLNLLSNLLPQTDYIIRHHTAATVVFILLFLFNQKINTIQCHTTIVTDDTTAPIGIRKSGYNMTVTCLFHLWSIGIKNSCIVCLVIFVKNFVKFGIRRIPISGTSLLCHLNSAIRHKGTLQRLVCLKAHNFFHILQLFLNIPRTICSQSGHNLCLHI